VRLLEKLGIRGTVLALVVVAVAIGLTVAGLVLAQVIRLAGLEREAARLDNALPRVRTIGRLVVGLETGQRGFVATGDPSFLEPYTAARHELPRLVGETRAFLAGDPASLAQLTRIEALIAQRIEERGLSRTQASTMDQLRASLSELDHACSIALVDRRREVDVAIRRLAVTIPVATALGCLLVLVIGAWTAHALRRCLEAVAEQGERMAEGEVEMTAAFRAQNEVGRLRRAFGLLASSLKAQAAETATARRRVALLAQASQRLGASLDVELTLNEIAGLAVPSLGDGCIVDLVDDDGGIRRVAIAHADTATRHLAVEMLEHAPDPAGPHPVAVAIRTGRPQMGTVRCGSPTDAFFATAAHLDLVRRIGTRAFMVVPLVARGRTVGAVSFVYVASGRCYEPSDLGLAEELARRAAVAIDNARLYAASQRAEARAGFLAEATNRVNASLDLDTTLENVAWLAVPELADCCVIDLLAVEGQEARTTVAHVDPEKADLVREMRRRYPIDGDGPSAPAQAISTRQPQIRVDITDAALEATATDATHLEMLRAFGPRSGVCVPLEARGRVLGTLTLASTRPTRRFGRADVALAEQIARKAALAVDNALLYREARLARSETRQQAEFTSALTSSLGEGVLALDLEGRISFANRAATETLGWAAGELVGQRIDATAHPPHDGPNGPCVLFEGLEIGRITRHDDDLFVVRSGQTIPVSLTASPVFGQGRVTGAVVVFRDVSRRVALEQRLRESHKMEAVGQLAGGIAHDFNNILTAILGYSELLGKSAGADRRLAHGLDEIRTSAQRAAGLTRQLLAFGRRQRLAPTVLDLEDALTRLAPALGRVVGEQVRVEVRHAPDLDRVKVDPGLLDEALARLAMNARDAMPQGGRLIVETDNAVLDSAYAARHADARPGAYVRITVRDTGSGMDANTLAHAFEPFYTTKEVGKGSGLGLAMVHGFVTQSGGHVAADSTPGAGSAFRIYLPRADEPAMPPAATAGIVRPRRSARETILLVDDEEALRRVARVVLEEHGYKVLVANDGQQALSAAAAHRGSIALLLTDVVMPGMNGRELAERLAAARPGIGVLYMSGYSADMLDERGGLEAGSALLEKPFTPDGLLRKVAEALGATARARIGLTGDGRATT
jgi:PAS domain S-box-containing protein